MDRVNIFNNVRTILPVFVAFEVLFDEDKNPGKGKQGSGSEEGRKGDNYFNNTVKELSIEDTAEYK